MNASVLVGTQWAAVTTWYGEIKVPPQLWSWHVLHMIAACQGHAPGVDILPPTISPILKDPEEGVLTVVAKGRTPQDAWGIVVGGESVCKPLPGAAPRKQKLDQKKWTLLRGEAIGLISKKTTFHTFLYISLPLFCTTTTWNVQKGPSCTFYGGNVVCVRFFLFHFFFHCLSFSPWWPLAFLIFSPPL